jgi:hypothetical protein
MNVGAEFSRRESAGTWPVRPRFAQRQEIEMTQVIEN